MEIKGLIQKKRPPDGSMVKTTLLRKMLLYFSLLFVSIIALSVLVIGFNMPFTDFQGVYKGKIGEVIKNFNVVADLEKERLQVWLTRQFNDAMFFSRNSFVNEAVGELREMVESERASGTTDKELRGKISESDVFRSLEGYFNDIIEQFENVTVIEVADIENGGNILVSTVPDNVGGNVFLINRFLNPEIPLKRQETRFERKNDSLELNLTLPVARSEADENVENPNIIMIIHIRMDETLKLSQRAAKDVGNSGEILFVNQEGVLLTPLKYKLHEGVTATPMQYTLNTKHGVKVSQGKEGITVARDYREEMVLAAYRYIPLSSGYGLGMVLKCDTKEKFHPFLRQVVIVSVIGLALFLGVISLIYHISLALSGPIRRLSKNAEKVIQGDLSIRMKEEDYKEAWIIADTFNQVISHIQNWHNELERQVDERTKELNAANELLVKEIEERKQGENRLKESFDRFRAIMDSLDALVYVADMETYELLYLNKYGLEVFGNIVGKICWQTLKSDQSGPCEFCTNNKLVDDSGNPTGTYAWEFRDTVTKKCYDCRDQAVRWTDGRLVRMEIASDVTKRVVYESEKGWFEKQLLQAHKMEKIGTFASSIAPEFNTILSTIINNAELLYEEIPSGSSLQKDVARILKGGKRAKKLVEQLLDFSRNKEVNMGSMHFVEAIKDCIEMLRAILPETIEIIERIQIEEDCVEASALDIQQVLMNLATNAAHAMHGFGVLDIAVDEISFQNAAALPHPDLMPGTYIVLTICDTGSGMDRETLEHIFEPFYTSKADGEGATGLSLSDVYGIVKGLKGSILVDSNKGKGTTFQVFFPKHPHAGENVNRYLTEVQ